MLITMVRYEEILMCISGLKWLKQSYLSVSLVYRGQEMLRFILYVLWESPWLFQRVLGQV